MKTLILGAALATVAGVAVAQTAPPPAAPPPNPKMERKLQRIDANRDGVVARDEWLAHAGRRFDRIDTNRDGRIDAAERAAMPQRHRRGPPPMPPQQNDPAK